MTEPPKQELVKQPIIHHVIELKNRVMVGLGAYLIATCISFFYADQILEFLLMPLRAAGLDANFHLIFTALPEVFMAHITLALAAGFVFAFPIIESQIWIFVAPGLYQKERRALLPYFLGGPVLFLLGAALCYFAAMPIAFKFFLSYQSTAPGQIPIVAQTRVQDYVHLTLQFIIIFGLIFQTPLIFLLLAWVWSHLNFLAKTAVMRC
jgi:sec-independent protein translocase protein TatC